MADLCAAPRPKDDHLMTEHVEVGMSSKKADAPSTKLPGAVIAWLILSTMMAIAGLILGAWATWKVQHVQTVQVTSPPTTSAVLVSGPQEAAARGYSVVSNVYRGTGYWSIRSRVMEHARSDHAVTSYNGSIYVFGGQSLSTLVGNLTSYNLYLDTVQELSPMPEPRYRFGYAVLEDIGKLYVFGGLNEVDGSAVDTTMIYDFKTDKWEPLDGNSPRMNLARVDLGGDALGGKVYAAGGYNTTDFVYNSFKSAEVLDPVTRKWTFIADMAQPRGDFRIIASNGSVYAIAGVTTIGAGDCFDWFSCHPWVQTVEAYNPNTGKWIPRASMEYPRGDYAVEVLGNGNILVAGGEYNYSRVDNRPNHVAIPWVEEYIIDQDIWMSKGAMSSPRFRFDMASDDGGFVYAFGGARTCLTDTGCNMEALNTIAGFYDEIYPSVWIAKTS